MGVVACEGGCWGDQCPGLVLVLGYAEAPANTRTGCLDGPSPWRQSFLRRVSWGVQGCRVARGREGVGYGHLEKVGGLGRSAGGELPALCGGPLFVYSFFLFQGAGGWASRRFLLLFAGKVRVLRQ